MPLVPARIIALFSGLTGPLLLSMVLLSVAHGLAPGIPRLYAGIAAWLAGVILWPSVKGLARLQILTMLGVGAISLAWAASMGRATDWESMLASNQALLSMLAAVSFLRLVTLPASAADDPAPKGPAALRGLFCVRRARIFPVSLGGRRLRPRGGLARFPLQPQRRDIRR